jgi:hypothetical protein
MGPDVGVSQLPLGEMVAGSHMTSMIKGSLQLISFPRKNSFCPSTMGSIKSTISILNKNSLFPAENTQSFVQI